MDITSQEGFSVAVLEVLARYPSLELYKDPMRLKFSVWCTRCKKDIHQWDDWMREEDYWEVYRLLEIRASDHCLHGCPVIQASVLEDAIANVDKHLVNDELERKREGFRVIRKVDSNGPHPFPADPPAVRHLRLKKPHNE